MKLVQVAAAVIERGGMVCLARRPDHLHQGGKWEFPGGKIEANESLQKAIERELKEELGIQVKECEPLIQIVHHYSDKSVCLNVVRVCQFDGEPVGMEGQEVRWVSLSELQKYDFPAANVPIVAAAQLPRIYVITPELAGSVECFLDSVMLLVKSGYQLIQIRTKLISENDWLLLQAGLSKIKQSHFVQFAVNSAIEFELSGVFDGIHLTSSALNQLSERPQGFRWVSASCHSQQELEKAQILGLDFVTLSPLYATKSHPGQPALGYSAFSSMLAQAKLPVYALGGVTVDNLESAIEMGAQGVAGISGFWPKEH